MHEYRKTGRTETDKCLELANKAHNYYFNDPLRYKLEFARTAKDFFKAIEDKFCARTKEEKPNDALKEYFKDNQGKYKYITTELFAIKDRLNIIINDPSLIDERTLFVLDHTARFIEIILPYACSVKEEVEHNKKFTRILQEEVQKEFTFFKHRVYDNNDGTYKLVSSTVSNKYLQAFYDNGWRAQKELNGLFFIKNYLDLTNPKLKEFYENYGGVDYFSSLTFSRLANEQFMKYLSEKNNKFWSCLESCSDIKDPKKKKEIIANHDNENEAIKIPTRIDTLGKAGILNKLIVREARLVNTRGNNIVHLAIPIEYSSCYHNLQLLNYLNKYCK